ncbi:hypothetical protein CA7LBN_004168 [Candidozyma auris]|uniref:Ubiquitin-like domain-containing protein n=2 Tax=Candidozyma auris TaxID=498019 RepID=A0A8F2W4B7_CANAR|nr:hypothetical protein CA7LBN_004168 [[Candida] auris]
MFDFAAIHREPNQPTTQRSVSKSIQYSIFPSSNNQIQDLRYSVVLLFFCGWSPFGTSSSLFALNESESTSYNAHLNLLQPHFQQLLHFMSDKQFFTTYAQLIRLSTDAPQSSFYSTEDYHKLKSLGPSLPKVPAAFPKKSNGDAAGEKTKLNFKSIKPPFKFSTSLEAPLSSTVFNIKGELVEAVAALRDAGVTASNLKMMVKAKVLSDTTQIGSVAKANEELSITVMVSPPQTAPTPATEKREEEPTSTEDPEEAALDPMVTEATWTKIGSLLSLDIGPERAQKAVNQFKTLV